MEKFCQSCSMPLELHGQDVRGSEKMGVYHRFIAPIAM
jgi:hypothetical protein